MKTNLRCRSRASSLIFPFRQSKSLFSSSFSNVKLIPTKFPWAACLLEGLVSSFSPPLHLSYTSHANERGTLNFLSLRVWLVGFCTLQIRTWKNSCIVAGCRQETVFTQLEESICTPSHLSGFCLPNLQWAQLIESTHGQTFWLSTTTQFHTGKDIGSSNWGSKLIYWA